MTTMAQRPSVVCLEKTTNAWYANLLKWLRQLQQWLPEMQLEAASPLLRVLPTDRLAVLQQNNHELLEKRSRILV
jgi:hypothetical protein